MNKTVLLIGGLSLGAGLMYALDPDRGQHRRTRARAQWQTSRYRANDLLGQAVHTVGHQTRGLLARAQPSFSAARTVGHQTRGLLNRVRPSFSSQWGTRERWSPGVEPTNMTQCLLMLGCAGLGAGLMYLLDPSIGNRRRAFMRDKARSYWKRQGDRLGRTARDVQNRTRGLVAEARTHLGGTGVPDDTSLVERVRAQMGHVVSNPGALGVTAHQGRVTLSGPIPADEVTKLLSTVKAVPGVTEVINQMEGHADTEHISGLQGRRTTS